MGARSFARIHAAATSSDPAVRDEAVRGKLVDAPPLVLLPDATDPANIDIILADFIAACANNSLPEVAFINSGNGWDEHPASTDRGMAFTYRVVQALASNTDVWNSTLLITTYDENDGLFDHVPPPTAPHGTHGEFVGGEPVGLGFRVPAVVVSPWSAGGHVCRDVLDHTSLIRIIEKRFVVPEPNISAWRRQTCGDFTSALSFGRAAAGYPRSPAALSLAAAQAGLLAAQQEVFANPAPQVPAANQPLPRQ
jgi:phospholipase C